jgi:serine/threonine protein phosphatase PrpC
MRMHFAAAPMLDVQFGQATDPGRVRKNNEDAMGSFVPASRHQARSHGYLFAVADGVGGMDLGEVASATAISLLTQEFANAQSGAMLISLLPRLIQHANAAVHGWAAHFVLPGRSHLRLS